MAGVPLIAEAGGPPPAGHRRMPRRPLGNGPHGPIPGDERRDRLRSGTIVVIHPLADDCRVLPIDKTGELVQAAPGFLLVVSYNPGYQQLLKELKPSTRLLVTMAPLISKGKISFASSLWRVCFSWRRSRRTAMGPKPAAQPNHRTDTTPPRLLRAVSLNCIPW